MDQFPNDASEVSDSDGDGVGNNADAFPNDASKSLDSDGDGVQDSEDSCEGYDDYSDTDNNGVPDGCDSTNDNTDTDCSISISIGEVSRSCSIPSEDLDWDGISDANDEDRDGDGRLDVSEISDTIEDNNPDTMDMSVMSSPYLDTIHSIKVTSTEGAIEIEVDYKISYIEFMAHVPFVTQYNEDGSPKSPENFDYTLDSDYQLNRLENQMCYSPNLGELLYETPRFPLWLENITIDSTKSDLNFECDWVDRRTIKVANLMTIYDDMELANWREVVRYTLIVQDYGQFSDNVEIGLVSHPSTQSKVWNVDLEQNTLSKSEIAYPWNENLRLIVPAPLSIGNNNHLPSDMITPTYTSGWSFIADVSAGQIDCSGYSSSTTDDLTDFYQQNDLEYIGLNGYHEYMISDDTVSISCSGL